MLYRIITVVLVFFFGIRSAITQEINFPADAVVNVALPPYNADSTGKTDATEAINKALEDNPSQGAIIYLPQGTYLISNTLVWGSGQKNTILQGKGIGKTIIKLKDNCSGFNNAGIEKEMIYTGTDPAQRFRNALRDLTIHTGLGNPGATGAKFCANNQGGIFNVIIKSGDGTGKYGVNFAYAGENGPLLVKDVVVEGFDIGFYCSGAINSQTFSRITLKNQNQYGIYNNGQVANIEDLVSINSVPAIFNTSSTSVMTIVGAKCTGYGEADQVPAIKNGTGAIMYAPFHLDLRLSECH
ncbi:MAG: hypothetical protein HC896_01520 [Bacteroidales bacterium]|nr:hypothetical protein [Bacteroidales bacterium]